MPAGGAQGAHGALIALRRRRAAAMRLPALPCGCHDPLNPAHQRGECQGGPR